MSASERQLLEISGLTVSTDSGSHVLEGVSFGVAAGERVGLIGESGSGKSMTALAATGLLPDVMTASGSILLDGHQVVGASERQMLSLRGKTASIVFQEPLTALDPLMRLGKQLEIPFKRHRKLSGTALRESVLAALREVQIADPDRVARSYPHEVSGGQRQRVAIAMALACNPRLLIADEPTTALDVTVQAEILALLDSLIRDRGMSLLFISHDLAVVSQITDRVIVLQHGQVMESSTVHEVLNSPTNDYTARLVASARELDSVLERVAAEGRQK